MIGRRAEQDLAECLERNCPPAQDVELALQASVEQFANGRYGDARRTLERAISRNRDNAAALPGPFSSLYATLSTVAEHEGKPRLWRASARRSAEVLRLHLGDNHVETLGQELALGDTMAKQGAIGAAAGTYRAVQQKAIDSGQAQIAAGAAFRLAWLELARGRTSNAEQLADEAVAMAGADDTILPELRDVLHMQIAVRAGDDAAIDAQAAQSRQSVDRKPRLLFAPGYMNLNPADSLGQGDTSYDPRVQFADVGFWIRPDGRTSEMEVLRDTGIGAWGSSILRQVGSRRYVPLDVEAGHPGLYRIERFTVRGTQGQSTGSRILRQMGNLTVHVVDLTETDAMNETYRRQMRDAAADGAMAPAQS